MSQYTSYYLYQKYVKYGDQDWIPVYPTEYSISGDSSDPQVITKKQDNDPECGYTPPVVLQYRWVEDGDNYICDDCGYTPTPQYRTISGVPYCTGYDKMVDTQYQVSYDSGSTWSTVSSSTLTVEHNSQDCGYTPPTPPSSGYANQYLTFRALESCSFYFSNNNGKHVGYSLDSGETWNTMNYNVIVQSGDTIMFNSWINGVAHTGMGKFSSSGLFEVEGNIMSLKYGGNFSGQTTFETDDYAPFYGLFSNCTGLTSAENLILPVTTLTNDCYHYMFSGCTSLTTAPDLPATTLANDCYMSMFSGCMSLTTAPDLPATTLANDCYHYMFKGCSSLTTAPELPATTLANYCYADMFAGCTSLTTAPALPATTLADYCYMAMFENCTSLTNTPILPATTLTSYCYNDMFGLCTSLTTAPALSATTLAVGCYCFMFSNCTSLTTAPELPATTLVRESYWGMFYNCASLSSVTCLATYRSATDCTKEWLYNVSSTGTFTKAASMSSWPTGYNGIPSGWTIQDYQG